MKGEKRLKFAFQRLKCRYSFTVSVFFCYQPIVWPVSKESNENLILLGKQLAKISVDHVTSLERIDFSSFQGTHRYAPATFLRRLFFEFQRHGPQKVGSLRLGRFYSSSLHNRLFQRQRQFFYEVYFLLQKNAAKFSSPAVALIGVQFSVKRIFAPWCPNIDCSKCAGQSQIVEAFCNTANERISFVS